MVLIASKTPIVIDADVLRGRLRTAPYAAAAFNVWRVVNVEGLLGRMTANENFSRAAADAADSVNTDDRTVVEFGLARTTGEQATIIDQIAADAEAMKASRPETMRGSVDWNRVATQRYASPTRPALLPTMLMQKAKQGDASIEPIVRLIARQQPIDAAAILSVLRVQQQQFDAATQLLHQAFLAYRTDPWADPYVMGEAVDIATQVAITSPERALALSDALSHPFAVALQEGRRRVALISISYAVEKCNPRTVAELRAVEPHPFWFEEILQIRARCYAEAGVDLAPAALRDLRELQAAEPASILSKATRSATAQPTSPPR